ncbi:MAG: hypothetical protein V2I97_09085 [Desulfococcaceae bacterium]|jgi:epoxyqueuosine reductase QueG|nr:hypothetical protein [Desulfococcaceae bacterium]
MKNTIQINDLRGMISQFAGKYPEKSGEKNVWREPLLSTADLQGEKNRERFAALRKIAADDHLMPWELMPSAKSLIVFFLPFTKELARENHKGEIPCRNWGLTYESTNRLIGKICEYLRDKLENRGFGCELTPATHNFDTVRLMARWSHKHLGYLAGLGKFGVNAQIITPSGCAGRMGSLVTEAETGDHPLVDARELCLHKAGYKCLVCVKRCPVGALSEKGTDRQKCWARLNENLENTEELRGMENTTHVCGKCQVLLPCSLKIPSPPSSDRNS